jgi:hypothetical protein
VKTLKRREDTASREGCGEMTFDRNGKVICREMVELVLYKKFGRL